MKVIRLGDKFFNVKETCVIEAYSSISNGNCIFVEFDSTAKKYEVSDKIVIQELTHKVLKLIEEFLKDENFKFLNLEDEIKRFESEALDGLDVAQ